MTEHDNIEYEVEEDFLSGLSASLIGTSIINQVSGEDELTKSPTDYLGALQDRIDFLKAAHEGDADLLETVGRAEREFYGELHAAFASVIGCDQSAMGLDPDQAVTYKRKIASLYNSLVRDRYANVLGLLYNHIFRRRKAIAKEMKPSVDKKDLSVSVLRRSYRNFDDVVIIHLLDEVIDGVVDEHMSMDDFLQLVGIADGDSVDGIFYAETMEGLDVDDPFGFYVGPILDDPNMRCSLESELATKLTAVFERK